MINLDDYRCGYVENHCIYNEVEDEKVTDFYNYYSQNGEDGVLEKIFEILDIKKGTFVNGGCDDIHDHSNVRRLVSTYGWDGLFIEPNGSMLSVGKENLENDERINNTDFNFHNGFLSINNDDERITDIIGDYYIGETQFDLLTLHIDSYEYWVLEDFLSGHYDAKVILVPAWSVVNPVVLAISVPATSTFTFLGSNPNILLLLSRPENTVVLPSPVKL